VPRRVRWRVVVGATVIASLVLFVPPVLAGALGGASPPGVVAGGSASVTGDDGTSLGPVGPGTTTVTYCDQGGTAETLDIEEPTPVPSGPVPAVVYVHGGGWTGGNSSFAPDSLVGQVASAVEAKGWVVVSINYRLAPRFAWPAQIDDATCAIRFLRANATSLHIDPRHIGAVGDSAGGQIVALLGLAGPEAGFGGGQDSDQSSSVQAVVDLDGPADLTSSDWAGSPVVQALAPAVFGTILGPEPVGSPPSALLKAASPVSYIGFGEPPFLIMQGDEDTVVPPDQSVELVDRLRAAGNPAELVMVHGAQHEFVSATGGSVTPDIGQLASAAAAFLVEHLGTR